MIPLRASLGKYSDRAVSLFCLLGIIHWIDSTGFIWTKTFCYCSPGKHAAWPQWGLELATVVEIRKEQWGNSTVCNKTSSISYWGVSVRPYVFWECCPWERFSYQSSLQCLVNLVFHWSGLDVCGLISSSIARFLFKRCYTSTRKGQKAGCLYHQKIHLSSEYALGHSEVNVHIHVMLKKSLSGLKPLSIV